MSSGGMIFTTGQGWTDDHLRASIETYRARPGNETGGNLHVVIEDGNIARYFLDWAQGYCSARGDLHGSQIAAALAERSPADRRRVLEIEEAHTVDGEDVVVCPTCDGDGDIPACEHPDWARLRVCTRCRSPLSDPEDDPGD